jgi:nucleoid DNA-binding protein
MARRRPRSTRPSRRSRSLAAGNEVKFTGFGKFSAVARPAREGRNPQTGESMMIAAKRAAKFSSAAELKKAVNG